LCGKQALNTPIYGPEGVQLAEASRDGILAGIVIPPYLSIQIYTEPGLSSEPSEVKAFLQV
jgi:hypothetical protein